ncbi:MAG: hypothetical protein AB4041_04655 [Microcystaceae cyanobacterium]
MLNQALNEIQSALDVLSQMAHSEPTLEDGAENLETVTNKVTEAIAILHKVEHSLKADKLTVISSDADMVGTPSDYYEQTWRKTA